MRPRLIFLVGGPDFHPVNAQAAAIIDWLGDEYACHTAESLAAFEHLTECDLLVLMGMHWTGWDERYRSPSDVHRRHFEKYVKSGRPVLAAHGAVASYDDWPRFGELVGFTLIRGRYEPIQPDDRNRLISETLQLALTVQEGNYQDHAGSWLRWQTLDGQTLLAGEERAEQEHQRAEREHQRAEQERNRAERLAARLRELGIDPDDLP